jgi:hypothetical protein
MNPSMNHVIAERRGGSAPALALFVRCEDTEDADIAVHQKGTMHDARRLHYCKTSWSDLQHVRSDSAFAVRRPLSTLEASQMSFTMELKYRTRRPLS